MTHVVNANICATCTCYRGKKAKNGVLCQSARIRKESKVIPTKTLIDNTGRVLMVWQGPMPDKPDHVRKFIDRVLKQRGKIMSDNVR